jgi:CRP-like cAMP-binding protein
MYLIQKGTVAIRKMKSGGFIELAKVYSNEVLGELAFFDRAPRSATAIALSEVEVLEIEFSALQKIYDKIPAYFKTILSCVAERQRKSNETIKRLQRNLVSAKEGVVKRGSQSDGEEIANVLAMLDQSADAQSETPSVTKTQEDTKTSDSKK